MSLSGCAIGSGFAHLDVLAIHDSEPVADIVGAVLDHGLEVRLLCLAIGGTPHRDLLSGVVGEMKAAGYRMVHASAGSRAWRVSFEARA